MNDDRCQHVPTSPGQSVCTCLDTRMWLEFVVQVQAQYIDYLTRDRTRPVPPINIICP
jgi:hypothetical protein